MRSYVLALCWLCAYQLVAQNTDGSANNTIQLPQKVTSLDHSDNNQDPSLILIGPPSPSKMSLSVVSYELANTYKLKADEYFINEEVYAAKMYYEKAKTLLENPQKFREEQFFDSHYITGSISGAKNDPGRAMCEKYYQLLKKDITYRLTLITAGIDFWGLTYANQVLLPADRYAKWEESIISMQKTYSVIDELYKKQVNLNRADQDLRNERIKKAYSILQDKKEVEINTTVQKTYEVQKKNYKGRRDLIMNEQQRLNEKAEALSKELETTENAMLNNMANAVGEAFGAPPLVGEGNLLSGGDLKIEQLIGASTKMLGPLEDLGEIYEEYEDVINVVKNAGKIKEFIEDPSDEQFMEILGDIAPENEDIKMLRDYYEAGNKIVKLGEKANKCVKDFSYDCFSENVNEIIEQVDIDPALKANWRAFDGQVSQLDIEGIAKDVESLIENGKFETVLDLGDKLAKSDPSFEAQWAKGKRLGIQLDQTINTGSFEDFKALGELIVKEKIITSEDLKRISIKVRNNKPVGLLLDYLNNPENEAYQTTICTICEYSNQMLTTTAVDVNNFEVAMNTSSTNEEFSVLFYQALIKAFPKQFLSLLSKNQIINLATYFQVATLKEYHLNTNSLDYLSKKGNLYYLGNTILPSIKEMKAYARNAYSTNPSISLKPFTELVQMNMNLLQKDLSKVYRATEIIEMIGDQKDAFYNQLVSSLDNNKQIDFLDYATLTQLGRHAILGDGKSYQGVPEAKAYRKQTMQNLVQKGTNSNDKAMKEALIKQALVMGLNSTIPGLGSAVGAAVDVLAGFSKANNLINQINDIANEMKTNEKELLRIDDELITFNLKSSVAQLEIEKTNLAIGLSDFEYQNSEIYLNRIDIDKKAIRKDLMYMMQLFFYESEVVRKNWHLLNKSTKFWHDYSLKDIIYKNPENVRLALDPDIRLFDWLNMSASGQRTNLEKIYKQWTQVFTIIKNNKDEVIYGPSQNIAMEYYPDIKLFDLIDPQIVNDFRKWQQDDKDNSKFNFGYALEKEALGNYYVDGRIVGLIFNNVKTDGTIKPLGDVQIKIDFPYYVMREKGMEEEILDIPAISTSSLSSEDYLSFRDANNYRKSWTEINRKPYPLEGVGIFGKMNFTVSKNRLLKYYKDIDEISMSILFKYDPTKTFNPIPSNEPAYQAVTIQYADSPYDKILLSEKEVNNLGQSINEITNSLEKRKRAGNIFDYSINEQSLTIQK